MAEAKAAAAPQAPAADGLPPAAQVKSATIAAPYRQKLQRIISEKYGGRGPKLVGFLANNDPAARSYAQWTARACEADGIRFELREVAKLELENRLEEANRDPEVHGIMIYYPCFGGDAPCFYGGSMDEYLRDSISYKKDVEGLCHLYRWSLYRNVRYVNGDETKKTCVPCTPLAVVKILDNLGAYDKEKEVGNQLQGTVVTIVNRSEIVGRPLAAMLANDGADVYSVDIDSIFKLSGTHPEMVNETPDLVARKSNIIITGVPVKSYRFPVEAIQPGTIVVNVSSFRNIDKKQLMQIPGVKYVSMVGKVTVAMLERNLLRLYENFHAAGPSQ